MKRNIHSYLRESRIEQGLSIQELSTLSGISASHISRIERGKRKPSPHTLKKIAPYLRVDYIQLLKIADLVDNDNPELVKLDEVLKQTDLLYKSKKVSPDMIDKIIKILEEGTVH